MAVDMYLSSLPKLETVFSASAADVHMAAVYVPLLFYVSSIGMVFPNGSALALAGHAEVAGMASALLGTLQFTAAAISTTMLSVIGEGSTLPMALVVLPCGVLAVVVNFVLLRGSNQGI